MRIIRSHQFRFLIFIAFVVLSMYAAESWWGINHLQFLPLNQALVFVFLAILAASIPNSVINILDNNPYWSSRNSKFVFPWIIAGLYGVIVWNFAVVVDPYGDAVKFEKLYAHIMTDSAQSWEKVLGFSLDAWAGQQTYEGFVELVSFYLKVDLLQAFKLLGTFFGVLYAWVWSSFVLLSRNSAFDKAVFLFVGLFSPYAIIFFGRTEVYAFPLLANLLWSIAAVVLLRESKLNLLVVCVFLFLTLLNLKAHPIALLTLPTTISIVLKGTLLPNLKLDSWRLFSIQTVPILVIGVACYFFVFGDHLDDRSLEEVAMQYDHLFLPLFSPQPPLQCYNLLSVNHIIDFVNVLLLGVPAAIVFLFNIEKAKARVIMPLIATLVIYLGLLFGINPLLSMPMDWDLFTLVAPVLLVVLFVAQKHSQNSFSKIALAFSIVGLGFFKVHINHQAVSLRVLSLSSHVHNTYYEWTANLAEKAYSIGKWSNSDFEQLMANHIQRLEDHDQYPIDYELSRVVKNFGRWYLREKQDPLLAEQQFKKSLAIDSENRNAQLLLTEALFVQAQYEEAYSSAKSLLRFNQPENAGKAYRMMADCALQAGMKKEALEAVTIYCSEGCEEYWMGVKKQLESD